MAKAKGLPDKIKVKIIAEVDRALYDRIKEAAKEQGLPGTIEDVLKGNVKMWFEGWKNIFDAMDNPQPIATPPQAQGILGPDGKPMGRA